MFGTPILGLLAWASQGIQGREANRKWFHPVLRRVTEQPGEVAAGTKGRGPQGRQRLSRNTGDYKLLKRHLFQRL